MSFLSDNFSTVTSGADLSTDSAIAWTKGISGASGALLADASNRIYCAGTIAAYVAKANPPAGADYTASMALTWLSQLSQIGPGARLSDPSIGGVLNGYHARYRAFHGFELIRIDSGTATIIGTITASEPTVNGQTVTLSVQVSGTSITGTVSGAVSGTITVADSTYASAGFAGIIGLAIGGSTTGLHATSITGTDSSGGGPAFIAPAQRPILQAVNRASTY